MFNVLLPCFIWLLFLLPGQDTMGWGENDRGVSFTFGAEVVAKFLHKHDFDLICRAHQVSSVMSAEPGHLHGAQSCLLVTPS